jgi:hypothetical protein
MNIGKLQFGIFRTNDNSRNGEMTSLFRLGKFGFKPSYLRVFFYLYFCKKFLQARYLFALLCDYLRLHGVSVIHLHLQLLIIMNWAFSGRDFERVMFISNV